MDRVVRLLLVLCLAAPAVRAQFREDTPSMTAPPPAGQTVAIPAPGAAAAIDDSLAGFALEPAEPGATEKLLYLAGATMGFALFDYIGYNLVREHPTSMPYYRVVQGLVQLGISWFLYEQVGLPTAIGFNVLWWTWGADAIFYGYTELFNVGGSWRGRGVFQSDIMDNNCTWASWTPVGIAQGMDPKKKIAGDALVAQSLVGAALAITITLHF